MGNTYTWIGAAGTAALASAPADWSPFGTPQPGDTSILIDGGTIQFADGQLSANTILAGNGLLDFAGDTLITVETPTTDALSLIATNTGAGVAQATTIDALGNFVNAGTILADGAAGSSLLINVGSTAFNGTKVAGYSYNTGVIQADAGNSVTIAVGPTAEIYSVGSLIADGGSILVTTSPSSIAGGWAASRNYAFIEAGGTIETTAAYASTVSGNTPTYFFLDSTFGDTLKIDNVGSFGGSLSGFGPGDTIDLGTLLSIGTIAYNLATNVMALENNSGTVVASLLMRSGAFPAGTFAVSGGVADGVTISTGSDGDTILTTNLFQPSATVGGSWQSPGIWADDIVPGVTDTPFIGQGMTSAFTVTTGFSPVTVNGFSVLDPNAVLRITSDTTATADTAAGQFGTLEVMPGQTLTATNIGQIQPTAATTIAAGATVALSGHENINNVGAVSGTLVVEQGGSYAAGFNGGTAEIDGSMLAGPTSVAGGGGSTTIGENDNGPAVVTVNGNGIAGNGVVTDTQLLLGSDPTSSGTLTLNGGGASWTDMIDNGDPLQSRGYALIGYNNMSTNTPAGVAPPLPEGPAQLLIENGATLADQESAEIADSPESAGTVTVTNGGFWNLANNSTVISNGTTYTNVSAGYLNVGLAGSGSLLVLNGGSVALGSVGTFVSNGTTFTGGGMGIGQSAAASGTVMVSGTSAGVASQLSTLNGIAVGKSGRGLLSILNGGTVDVNGGGIGVGTTATSTASGTVDVGGGTLASALNFAATSNGLGIGNAASATGVVNVSDNGTITLLGSGSAGQGFLGIGNAVGSTGSVVVGGTTAAAVINVGNGVNVGSSGTGALTVNPLGTVALASTAGGITVGGNAGAVGTMIVNGGAVTEAASTSSYGLTVGYFGEGSLLAENGGSISLSANGMSIASGSTTANGSGVTITTGAILNNTGTSGVNVGGLGSGSLTVSNGGSIVMAGAGSLNIDSTSGTASQMTVAGGTVTFSDPTNYGMTVGNAGTGTMTVSDSGTDIGTVATDGYIGIGNSIGSHGSLIVGGTSVSAVFSDSGNGITVGNDGTGALSVNSLGTVALTGTAGITIGYTNGASGMMTVNGGHVTEAATSYGINMANNAGAASAMLVENAGTVSMAGGGLNIAAFASLTSASVTVTGAGALLQYTGPNNIDVGGSGSGTLTVSNGGSLAMTGTGGIGVDSRDGTASAMSVAAAGVLSNYINVGISGAAAMTVSDGGIVNLDTYSSVGLFAGSSGSVVIGGTTSAAAVNLSGGNLNVGLDGNGALTVNHLGTLALTGTAGIVVGYTASAIGTMIVNGGVVTEASTDNGVSVGVTANATGSMLIENQGSVTIGGGGMFLASGSATTGTVTVMGSGSRLSNTGSFNVGGSGLGDLSIEEGGAVTTTGSGGMVIAGAATASGSVNVTGAGSNLQVGSVLAVGGAGFGQLSVSQGATATATSIDEASAATGDGVISVAGTGSSLTLTGSLTVGDQAAGEVSILNGATVSALDVTIGNASAASSGNVDVEGAGSALVVGTGGVLNVGVSGGGSGVLTIGPGTTLHSNAGVVEAGHASFNNNGGVVDPPFVDLTTQSNSGLGSNLYDLYVENIGAVQIVSGTGTWDTPMMLTGTSVSDASNNINVNGDQGEWQLSSGGTLIVNANTVDSGQAIVFEDATDTLVIGQIVNNGLAGVSGTAPVVEPGAENLLQAGGFAAAIWGYQTGDQIAFDNMSVTSASVVNGNTVDLFGSGNVSLGSLAFFTKSGSKASDAGAAAAALQIPVQCFAAGTRIETADGWVRVEDLRVGDRLVTADGDRQPIVWIGQRVVNCERHPTPETVWPVRIQAGALSENVPVRDLYLSPDHAVFVNGVLIPVKLLINGTTVRQGERDRVRYFHVELPGHAVILAEGLTVESYLDTGDRARFSGGPITALYPDFAARTWEMAGCAPLVLTGEVLHAARAFLADRAAQPRGAFAGDADPRMRRVAV